jgi:hypothetical protein
MSVEKSKYILNFLFLQNIFNNYFVFSIKISIICLSKALETELPSHLKEVLPCDYKYQLEKLDTLPSLFTEEDIELKQFTVDYNAYKQRTSYNREKTYF